VKSDVSQEFLEYGLGYLRQMDTSFPRVSDNAAIFDTVLGRGSLNDSQARICPDRSSGMKSFRVANDGDEHSGTDLTDMRNGLKKLM